MKLRYVPVSLGAFAFLIALVFFAGCSDDNNDNTGERVSVNDVLQDGAIQTKGTSSGVVVDARTFASKIPDGNS